MKNEESVDAKPTVTVLSLLSDAEIDGLRRRLASEPAEYSTWRTWDVARDMQNRKLESLLEEMAARLRGVEEKVRRLEDVLRKKE